MPRSSVQASARALVAGGTHHQLGLEGELAVAVTTVSGCLLDEELASCAPAARPEGIVSVGVDSWAIDYGLLDQTGALLGNPFHYRDGRTEGIAGKVHAALPFEDLYATTGLQFLPFNTVYQLAAAAGSPQLEAARTLLLIPDLLGYWLTGEVGAEQTNASTTGLPDLRRRQWSTEVLRTLGLSPDLLPPLLSPGEVLGLFALRWPRRPGCRRRRSSPPSGRTTPPRRWSGSRPMATGSPTWPAAPGRRSGSSCQDAVRLPGNRVDVVHLVGGGARNPLLCQLAADACRLPVLAGPVEATALGNVLVQARAHGSIDGDLQALRSLVRATQRLHRYEPSKR